MTIPLPAVPLPEHRERLARLVELGYTDLWSLELDAYDAFTPLALAAAWVPEARLGTAIAPVFTRGPAVMAMTAAALANAAPGRFTLGLGTSSPVIVQRWNSIPFEQPVERVRDLVRFLRAALAGERVQARYDTFAVDGFRLSVEVPQPPPILIAALRPTMLRLAGEEGDGAIVNWLSAEDVATVAPYVGGKEIVARIFVIPSSDRGLVRHVGTRTLASYFNVPAYAAFQRWLGRGEALTPMWEAWAAGDRRRATEVIPDAVIDDLIVHGTWSEIRERVDAYVANGVTTPVLSLLTLGDDLADTVERLAPGPA
jgi:probable F420-dependent oxidoreductase